jgi:predicted amidohydrolase YtcJ
MRSSEPGSDHAHRRKPSPAGLIPDRILFNGKIVTVDANFSVVEAMAIRGDRIQATGTNAEILELAGPATEMLDLQGKTALPGLIEAHAHPVDASKSELIEEIPDVNSIRQLLDYIVSQAKRKPPGEWIVHSKFFSTRLKEMRQPTRHELDHAAPDHPIFLNGSFGGMINSCAMRAAGISKDSDHQGILKDARTGEPTGAIHMSAFSMLKGMPAVILTYEERLDALEAMLRRYNQVGFTSVTDAYQPPAELKLYLDLWKRGRLPTRACVHMAAPPFESREQFAAKLAEWGLYSGFGNEMVRIGALKFLFDGGILTGTAYLREPWGEKAGEVFGIEDPDYRGIISFPETQLREVVSAGNEHGWKIAVHCTGGGAVDMLLKAYEEADALRPIRPQRSCIVHGNFFTPEAIEKCAELGIIADCQPAWFYKDADAMKHILGADRVKNFLPLRSLFDAGVIVNGGSDHMVKFDSYRSVNPYNPFLGMWTAIARQTERGTIIEPSQALTREQALRMYTIHNAYGTFEEDLKGSLEPGKLADLILISTDYLTCPVADIRDIQVEMTLLGGKIVYRR